MARFGFAFFDSGVRFDTPDARPTSMRDLASFLKNPFDDPAIGINALVAFTTDHLQRMIANNTGGEFTARITATTSSLALVEDCVTQDHGRLGIRMAAKAAKDRFRRDNLPPEVKRVEAGFIAAFGASSPILLQALPKGRDIFNSCRDDQMAVHLQTLATVATAQSASLAPATVALANTLKDQWQSLYDASEGSSGGKTTTEQGKRLARENLQLMLFLNLVKLMEMFPRQPEMLALYMQQHLLETPSTPEEPTPPPAPAP